MHQIEIAGVLDRRPPSSGQPLQRSLAAESQLVWRVAARTLARIVGSAVATASSIAWIFRRVGRCHVGPVSCEVFAPPEKPRLRGAEPAETPPGGTDSQCAGSRRE